MMLLKEITYFILPLLLTNLFHHFIVIRYQLFSQLARPIDFGKFFLGKPILGKNKTFRGLIVLTFGNGLFMFLVSLFIPGFSLALQVCFFGMILGFGYALGELPNSFAKRRIGIKESCSSKDSAKIFFFLMDHFDSVLVSTIALSLIYHVSGQLFIALVLVGGTIHFIVDLILRRVGYKKFLN